MRLKVFALFAPFDRILDAPHAPGWSWLAALLGAGVSYLMTDVFTSALGLIICSSGLDYVVGVRAAKARKAYDPEIAHAGFLSKVSGVALMMLVRMLEDWMMRQDLVNTGGWIAAALTLSLFAVDLESIQAKREELGSRPIPGLSTLTAFLNAQIARVLPSTPSKTNVE